MRTLQMAMLGAVAVLAMTGCVGARSGLDDRDDTSGGRQQVSCADASSVTLDGRGTHYVIDGDCAEVIVRGDDLDVRMSASTALSIEGRDNDVESATELGAVTIKGDDNSVEARTIASISIAGNENDVEARTIGSVEISGNENDVESDNDPQPVRTSGQGNTVERR